jgi:predicted unusual protein kinase regulating ubiquinone biosynthesis (AarF/ABC1/UbiB family)
VTNDREDRGRSVPSGRLSRIGVFGRLAGGIAGGIMAEGARRLASGERPRMRDLLLTPGNVGRVADQLAHLRGAAMKLGQMISMDAGDVLPPELSQIMARLRERALRMPPKQLGEVLNAEWGSDWRNRLSAFDANPIAAASIGQVHRAKAKDGRPLAIKVQYPGVARSIDADVDNVATLLRISGLLPPNLKIGPLLEEAKRQLREEADYLREAAQMTTFGGLLADQPQFVVPTPDPGLTTPHILAMTFVEGRPVESLADAPQADRDRVMRMLLQLVLRELLEFGVMQTDPNFANYRYQSDTGRLVLLDFGAARPVGKATQDAYLGLLQAGLSGDHDRLRQAAISAGILTDALVTRHGAAIDRMLAIILDEIGRPGSFDFGDRGFVAMLREEGTVIAGDRSSWHVPPADILFAQRKISGTALLAARLKARVDVRSLVMDAIESGAV